MEYYIDIHTHTIASGHAYATLLENVSMAKNRGLKILGMTDHGPLMPGGPHLFHFYNLKVIPREIDGILILRGCEANIVNFHGELDIPDKVQEQLDIVIASLHDVVLSPGSREENTTALMGAMNNPKVHIIGHPGNPAFPIDEELIVKTAKEKDIMIEINNSSFGKSRIGSKDNCIKIAKLCKKYGVKILIGSDAHISYQIGEFRVVDEILREIDMPNELIMNLNKDSFIEHMKSKNKLLDI